MSFSSSSASSLRSCNFPMGCVAGTVTPGIWGRQHGGVRARGELRQSKRNFLSYMMRVPVFGQRNKNKVSCLSPGNSVCVCCEKIKNKKRSKRALLLIDHLLHLDKMHNCQVGVLSSSNGEGGFSGKRRILHSSVHSGVGWGLPLQWVLGNQSTKQHSVFEDLGLKPHVGLCKE